MEYRKSRLAVLSSEHDQALANLLTRPEMKTDQLRITTQRWPDVCFLPKLKSDQLLPIGLFVNEKLSGFALFGMEQRWVAGQRQSVWSLSRVYVAPEARGLGFILRLGDVPEVAELTRGRLGYANVIVGNRQVESYLNREFRRFPSLPKVIACRSNVTSVRPAIFLPRRSSQLTVRQAKRKDADVILHLLRQQSQRLSLGKQWDRQRLENETVSRPGTNWSNWWIAEQAGQAVGTVFAWESSRCNRCYVHNLGVFWRLLIRVWNSVCRRIGFPRLPREGEVVPMVSFTDLCMETDTPQVARTFVSTIGAWARKRGLPLLSLSTDVNDPAQQAFRSILGFQLQSHLLLMSDQSQPDSLTSGIHYCDSDLL